jgi:hypothetical protein
MKVENPNLISSKYGVIFSLIIVISLIIISYSNSKNIKTLEEDLDPKQRTVNRSCNNFEKVVSEFTTKLNLDLDTNPEKINDLNLLLIKVDGIKPLLRFKALNNAEFELTDRQLNEALILFEKGIDFNIKKLGLINNYNYSEFNKMNYLYKQSESFYTISIPTKVETSVVSKMLEIRCGVINSDFLNVYSRVEKNYSEKQIIDLIQIDKNLHKFNVRNLDSTNSFIDIYDFSQKIPRLTNQTQDIN